MKSNTHAPMVGLAAVVLLVGVAVSPSGLAEPWIAFLTDTGVFGDTGPSDTALPASDDTASDVADADGTGDTGGSGGSGGSGGDTATSPEPAEDTGSGGDTEEPSDTGSGGSDTGEAGDTAAASETVTEDTGPLGMSAAELAGERGGCGCAAAPQPVTAWAWIATIAIALRRRMTGTADAD